MIAYLLIGAAVFGLCFLADKGFSHFFRGKSQHSSGKSVRLSCHVCGAGLAVSVLGILGLISGHGWLVIAAGLILLAVGIGLIVHYLSFGIYYDEDTFLLSVFGKRSVTYQYRNITGQQLYISGRRIILELHMDGGRTVQLPLQNEGSVAFLNTAFRGYCSQRGLCPEDCDWYDPDHSCWFPKTED